MRILVLGASRGIGAEVVTQALEAGHEVVALARSAADMPERPGLERVTGDATDAAAIGAALPGVDAVILAIGLGTDPRRFLAPTTLFSDAARAVLAAMPAAGVTRLIVVTGFGAGESKAAMSLIERTGHRAILGRAYADKDVQEEMVQASDLDWTIVRPGILTKGAHTGKYRVLADPAEWRNGMISRADVADYLVKAAESGLHSRRSVVLVR